MFGSEICRVRGSRDIRDFDFDVFCELLYPQCWSGRSAMSLPADASILTSSTALSILVFLLMSTPRSLSVKTAPSPGDVPFTRASNSDPLALNAMTPCVALVERTLDDDVLLCVLKQLA